MGVESPRGIDFSYVWNPEEDIEYSIDGGKSWSKTFGGNVYDGYQDTTDYVNATSTFVLVRVPITDQLEINIEAYGWYTVAHLIVWFGSDGVLRISGGRYYT